MNQDHINRISAAEHSFRFLFEQRKGGVVSLRRLRSAEKNQKICQQQNSNAQLCWGREF